MGQSVAALQGTRGFHGNPSGWAACKAPNFQHTAAFEGSEDADIQDLPQKKLVERLSVES